MQNYATATIEGYATQEPNLKTTPSGKLVCHFSLAVNHYTKENADHNVSFIDIEVWEKIAEICSENISKGKRIMVIGDLKQDRWEDKEGRKQSKVKIVGHEIRFLESFKKEPLASAS